MIKSRDILAAKILIVDDQDANISLLTELLTGAGFISVFSTTDPKEVCALHRKNNYDLILLDLQMPEMDGFQVMEALKTNKEDAYLPVLVITAQPGHKLRALQSGAKDFISKPFDLVEIKTRIYNMLEVRLLYKRLENYNRELEEKVRERTAELQESEARFRSLTELASDWYWEQDDESNLTRVSGPVLDMLGLRVNSISGSSPADKQQEWDAEELAQLREYVEERRPFREVIFTRTGKDGTIQRFQVSGEPMFDSMCRCIGYRGIGLEITEKETDADRSKQH